MSQPNEVASNGPTQHSNNNKPDVQEGVKLVTGSNGVSLPAQQTFSPSGVQQPHLITDQNRPPLRRADSRGGQPPLRHPAPNPNIPQQNIHQAAPNQGIVNRPLQNRPPQPGQQYIATRPPLNQGQRFPNQIPAQRYVAPEILNQDQRRVINSSSPEGYHQQRPQIPPQRPQQPIQSNTRPPNISNQPRTISQSPQSSFDQTYKKLDSESYSHDEPDRYKEKPILSQIKNQSFSQSKNSDITSPTVEEKQFHSDNRSSSSLGYHQDPEKDVDTTVTNGKTRHDEITTDRPDSRSGHHKEQTLHTNMHKIEEDDDDSVITPSRFNTTANVRSNEHINQKNEFNEQNKPKIIPDTKPLYSSEVKQAPQMSKFQTSPKPNVPLETRTNPYPQPQNYTSYSTENTTKSESDNKYMTPTNHESDYQFKPHSNENELVTATMKNMTNEPRVTAVPPQKPNLILNPTNKKPPIVPTERNQPGSETWAPTKENIKSPSTPQSYLSPSNVTTPRDKERKITSPRTENNNLLNRRSYSARSQRSEGDNDSGVDESTQGNDQSCNGDNSSPKKTQKPIQRPSSAAKCKTPIKSLQSPKSPDSVNSIPSATDKKKVPMNKVNVGNAPSPNLKAVKSKIGSLENATHKPTGGKVKIENKKLDFSKVTPRIAAKNDAYVPTGGEKKIVSQKLQWNVKSKVGSLDNANYKPKGGDKKIESVKLDFKEKAKPKVGSKDNIKHVPGGGDIKIDTVKLDIKAQSKVGSLDNVKHKPGGGDIKIFDDRQYLKQKSTSSIGGHSALSGSQEYEEDHNSSMYEPMSLNYSASNRRVRYVDMDGPYSLGRVHQSEPFESRRCRSANSSFRKKYKPRSPIPIEERPRWRY